MLHVTPTQRDQVLSAQAHAFVDETRYFQAAQCSTSCSVSLEEGTLKCLDVGERDARRSYLISRLEQTRNAASLDMLQNLLIAEPDGTHDARNMACTYNTINDILPHRNRTQSSCDTDSRPISRMGVGIHPNRHHAKTLAKKPSRVRQRATRRGEKKRGTHSSWRWMPPIDAVKVASGVLMAFATSRPSDLGPHTPTNAPCMPSLPATDLTKPLNNAPIVGRPGVRVMPGGNDSPLSDRDVARVQNTET